MFKNKKESIFNLLFKNDLLINANLGANQAWLHIILGVILIIALVATLVFIIAFISNKLFALVQEIYAIWLSLKGNS